MTILTDEGLGAGVVLDGVLQPRTAAGFGKHFAVATGLGRKFWLSCRIERTRCIWQY